MPEPPRRRARRSRSLRAAARRAAAGARDAPRRAAAVARRGRAASPTARRARDGGGIHAATGGNAVLRHRAAAPGRRAERGVPRDGARRGPRRARRTLPARGAAGAARSSPSCRAEVDARAGRRRARAGGRRRSRRASRSGLLVADGAALRFRHELARTAVEASIPPPRALQLHARVLARARGAAGAAASRWPRSPTTPGAPATSTRCCAGRRRRRAKRRRAARAARRRRIAAPRSRTPTASPTPSARPCSTTCADAQLRAQRPRRGDRRRASRRSRCTRGAGDVARRAERARCGAGDGAGARAAQRRRRRGEPARDRAASSALPPGRALARGATRPSRTCACSTATATTRSRGASRRSRSPSAVDDRATLARRYKSVGAATDVRRLRARRASIVRARSTIARALDDGGACIADALRDARAPRRASCIAFDAAERYLAEGIAFARRHDLDRLAGYMESWQALCDLYRGRWALAGERANAGGARQAAGTTNRVVALVALGRLRMPPRRSRRAARCSTRRSTLAVRSGTLQRLGAGRARRAPRRRGCDGDGDAPRARGRARLRARGAQAPSVVARRAGVLALAAPAAAIAVRRVDGCAAPYRLQIEGDWRERGRGVARARLPVRGARALADGDEPAQRDALADARPARRRAARRAHAPAHARRRRARGAARRARADAAQRRRPDARASSRCSRCSPTGWRNARDRRATVALGAHGRAPRRGDPRQARRSASRAEAVAAARRRGLLAGPKNG